MRQYITKKLLQLITVVCLVGLLLISISIPVMAQDPFVGEIKMFAGNFAPRGWALCDGQLLEIASYTALFSLLGTTYGGDGVTTFALPDLRGRFPMHPGTGMGLTPRALGEKGGTESVTLNVNQIPYHNHETVLHAFASEGDSASPSGNVMAKSGQGDPDYYTNTPDTTLRSGTVEVLPAGGSQPHTNMSPFQTVNFIIALQGIYPSRN